jgi:anti-sigma-K factor RskA
MTQAQSPISDAERELAAGYIFGDLNPEELRQFEALLNHNSALQAEVQALRVSLRLLPQGLAPVAPPPHLRDRILTAQVRSTSSPRRRMAWPLVITGIAVLVTLLSSLANWRLRRDLQIAQEAPPPTAPPNRVAPATKPPAVKTILQQPKSRLVTLRSTNLNRPVGTLLFTPGRWQEIVVTLSDLPPLSSDRAYQMWLSLNNGQVLSCGKFKPNAAGQVFVTLHPPQSPPKGVKATGVFVTREAGATPSRPQGDKILLGEI